MATWDDHASDFSRVTMSQVYRTTLPGRKPSKASSPAPGAAACGWPWPPPGGRGIARHLEDAADLLERVGVAVADAVAELDDLAARGTSAS